MKIEKNLVKESLDRWDDDLIKKLLDEFEKIESLDLSEYSWERIHEIKKALWIGFNFKNKNKEGKEWKCPFCSATSTF